MNEAADKLNNQAILLAGDGSYREAVACFARALTLEQDNHLLWYNLGIMLQNAGRPDDALHALERAHEIDPEDEDTINALAVLCFGRDDMARALIYCAEGILVNSDNPQFWNTTGVVYFNQQNYENASAAFEEAVTLNPYYYDALFNLRDTYEQLGNSNGYEECRRRLQELKNGEANR